jgi:nitrite reductase/ring-hydroxylating ferredoxin subunit
MSHIIACKRDDLSDGQILDVTVDTLNIAVARCADKFYAIHNVCPHKGAPLCQGTVSLRRAEIICPWHRFRFALATGKSATNDEIAVRTFPVRVVDGDVIIDLA